MPLQVHDVSSTRKGLCYHCIAELYAYEPENPEPASPGLHSLISEPDKLPYPEGPRTQKVYTLAPKYLYRDYVKAKVYTIRAHGPSGLLIIP